MSSANNEDDSSFESLSLRLRQRVDDAFDSIVSQWRLSKAEVSAGGFIVEEPRSPSHSAEYEAGGFIVEDASKLTGTQSYIPLLEIPRALNLLDLFPDDDLMGVFQNAAAGWGAQDACHDGVSRKDWRAICAAVLEGEHVDEENLEDIEMDVDSGPDSDVYQTEASSGDTEENSSDAYEEPGPTSRKTKTQNQPPAAQRSMQLTDSQKAQCRQDFGRLLSHVPDSELDHQRIMIKDITRVAELLKENLKTEDILEMVEAFSTSPDKSISLADFEHMMVTTKLI